MNHISLRLLRTFVTVAEKGTVAGAAEKLARSSASVSSAISEFEQLVGLQLFVRKPAKGLALTPAGEVIALEARGLLSHADEFETIAGALGSAIEGELAVGCFINLAPVVFGNLVAQFSAQYPGIRLQIVLGDHEEILQSLKSGRIETALTFDLSIPDQFQITRMVELPPYALLPIFHPLAQRATVSLTDLAPEPFILMDLPHTREYFLSVFHALGIEPNVKFRSSSYEAVRTMVGNGLGYSVLTLKPMISVTYDGTEVINVPIEDRARALNIAMLGLKKIAKRRIVLTFQDFTRGYLKNWHAKQS